MSKMNQQEALEFFQGTKLNFTGFFKYCFYYEGNKDGIKINVVYGGDSDDIYRTEYGPIEIFNKNEDFEYFNILNSESSEADFLYQFSEL